MSLESFLVERIHEQCFAGSVTEVVAARGFTGCSAEVVAEGGASVEPGEKAVISFAPERWGRVGVWFSDEEEVSWEKTESVFKVFSGCPERFAFEIVGNAEGVDLRLAIDTRVSATVENAIGSVYPGSLLEGVGFDDSFGVRPVSVRWREFFPRVPFYHNLSLHGSFGIAPILTLMTAMASLPGDCVGLYQCIFKRVKRADYWRNLSKRLSDLGYLQGVHRNAIFEQSSWLQSPSTELKHSSDRLAAKLDLDAPLFFCIPRIAILGEVLPEVTLLQELSSFMSHFQFGGLPFSHVDREFHKSENGGENEDWRKELELCYAQRHGFLVNSTELTSLAHFARYEDAQRRGLDGLFIDHLALEIPDDSAEGTFLGSASIGSREKAVFIPASIRERSTHIISASGMGKSTLMIEMCLQDIMAGKGCLFIDPHGDAVEELLSHVPAEKVGSCLYFNPGLTDRVPLWNPLANEGTLDPYRLADDLLSCIERVSRDWGDRLGTIIRNGLHGLVHLEGSTLVDLYNLTRQRSPESEALRKAIVRRCPNPTVKTFWAFDFLRSYKENDLASARHKLQKFLSGRSLLAMFGQKENRFDFRKLMDKGRIVIADLSDLSIATKSIVGSFLLSQVFLASLSRSNTSKEQRRKFSVFADEAQLFLDGDSLEQFITQARKYGINITIAHQYLKQFKTGTVDAFSTTGSTIIGRVDKSDAYHLSKDLSGRVKPEELINLEPYNMVARIGSGVARFRTTPLPAPGGDQGAEIKERSYREYYEEISKIESGAESTRKLTPREISDQELRYEEF